MTIEELTKTIEKILGLLPTAQTVVVGAAKAIEALIGYAKSQGVTDEQIKACSASLDKLEITIRNMEFFGGKQNA